MPKEEEQRDPAANLQFFLWKQTFFFFKRLVMLVRSALGGLLRAGARGGLPAAASQVRPAASWPSAPRPPRRRRGAQTPPGATTPATA